MSPEQAALLRKAKSSLKAARLLARNRLYGFAVSRAYYAMFYVAEAFLLGRGLAFSKHSGVISAFGQHFVKTGEVAPEFHRYLIDGQNRRNLGDYDVTDEITPKQARSDIAHAKAFLELARQHLGPMPRSRKAR